jgi:galactofuranosylgalactofuranosylrhamnosyl-N-acetylglucosaminyl-diphospho-decaprenol beta-1,5/1,6-galactofuranosyltransferase
VNEPLHILQSAIWPQPTTAAPDELYFHTSDPSNTIPKAIDGRVYALALRKAGIKVSFPTFFGALSIQAWRTHGGIKQITARITISGKAIVNLYAAHDFKSPARISAIEINSGKVLQSFDIPINLDGLEGIVYPEIMSLNKKLEIISVEYLTSTPPRHTPSLAIVMPTFRREAYATRTCETIRDGVFGRTDTPVKLYVIDNGGTLSAPAHPDIHYFKNKNYGGAGGFARGMIESSALQHGLSHILFCDDDIMLEPESILRLANFLQYAPQDAIIPGGMLEMGNKGRLHEIGAVVSGVGFSGNKASISMKRPNAVIDYNNTDFSNFFGWWFVCYPAPLIQDHLPFPAFVGFDDVEMGRYLQGKAAILNVSGIAVWHEEFQRKDVHWRWYYHARNGLAAHYAHSDEKIVLSQLWHQTYAALASFRYERAEFMVRGVQDFLKGPEFIKNLPADKFHEQLTATQKQKATDLSRLFAANRARKKVRNVNLRRWLGRIFMNGHLVPGFLMRNSENPSSKSWAFEKLHSTRTEAVVGYSTMVYYDPINRTGFICQIDRLRFFTQLARAIYWFGQLHWQHRSAHERWSKALPTLSSKEFWATHLLGGVAPAGRNSAQPSLDADLKSC